MKLLIILCALAVSCVSASHLGLGGPGALASTGSSSQFRSEDNYGNYQFVYDEEHASGSSGRREERSGDVVRGSYRLNDADGRQRIVSYVADESGFHANIQTNEPGVDPSRDPADVLINKEAQQIVAPAPILAAPAPAPAPAPLGPLPGGPVLREPQFAANTFAGPVPVVAAPVQTYEAAPALEAPTPRAFSYSFGGNHPNFARAAAAAVGPAPILGAPAPVFQQSLKY